MSRSRRPCESLLTRVPTAEATSRGTSHLGNDCRKTQFIIGESWRQLLGVSTSEEPTRRAEPGRVIIYSVLCCSLGRVLTKCLQQLAPGRRVRDISTDIVGVIKDAARGWPRYRYGSWPKGRCSFRSSADCTNPLPADPRVPYVRPKSSSPPKPAWRATPSSPTRRSPSSGSRFCSTSTPRFANRTKHSRTDRSKGSTT